MVKTARVDTVTLMHACATLVERGEPITARSVWAFFNGSVSLGAVRQWMSRAEDRGLVERVARTQHGRGCEYTYALTAVAS